jgi:hypothetical protein
LSLPPAQAQSPKNLPDRLAAYIGNIGNIGNAAACEKNCPNSDQAACHMPLAKMPPPGIRMRVKV